MLGAVSAAAARQVARALKAYQPGKWYGVRGAYTFDAAWGVTGAWQGRKLVWGWTDSSDNAWTVAYALHRVLRPDVALFTNADVPEFVRAELAARARAARAA